MPTEGHTSFERRFWELEEAVRRLRLRNTGLWPWYSLQPYLCAGWVDPYATVPYRFDLEDGVDAGWHLGFFDTGQTLLFTGVAQWDPQGWWVTPPRATGDLGGEPDISFDAVEFIRPQRNAFGTAVAADHEDAGRALPYTLPEGNGPYCLTPKLVISGGGANYLGDQGPVGGYAQLFGFNSTLGCHFTFAGSGAYLWPKPFDETGFTHNGVPENFQLDFNGQQVRYAGRV